MASNIFKQLNPEDVTNSRVSLHEHIPITGTLISGTYGGNGVALGSEPHIKTYSHGMFESVYDYPYLSSSANHIMDITAVFSAGNADSSQENSHLASGLSGSAGATATMNNSIGQATQQEKKINMYNQMAQVLSGYDLSGSIANFDQDGVINNSLEEAKINSGIVISLARLLVKDEIKKGSFELSIGVGDKFAGDGGKAGATTTNNDAGTNSTSAHSQTGQKGYLSGTGAFKHRIKITDGPNASKSFLSTSPSGEFGVLYGETETSGQVLSTECAGPYYVLGKRSEDVTQKYFYPVFTNQTAANAFSTDSASSKITIKDLAFGEKDFYIPNVPKSGAATRKIADSNPPSAIAEISNLVQQFKQYDGPAKVGLIYYQAGVCVLTSSLFQGRYSTKGSTTNSAAVHFKDSPVAAQTFGVDRGGSGADFKFRGLLDPGVASEGPYFVVTNAPPTAPAGIAAHGGGAYLAYGRLYTTEFAARVADLADGAANWAAAAATKYNFTAYPGIDFYMPTRVHADAAAQKQALNATDSQGGSPGFQSQIDGVHCTLFGSVYSGASPSGSFLDLTSAANTLPNMGDDFVSMLTGSNISVSADFLRSRIFNLQFNNTTELNSQVIFCRADANEFNYSSNRTYLQKEGDRSQPGSKIRVMQNITDKPRAYITTVGLYSSSNELMAVAKLSEPLRKDPDNTVTLRVRLDY